MCVIRAKVHDPDTQRIIQCPQVFAHAGSEARVRTGLVMPSGEPSVLSMGCPIAEGGKGVRYSWPLTTDGEVVSSHSAEFELYPSTHPTGKTAKRVIPPAHRRPCGVDWSDRRIGGRAIWPIGREA